MHLIQTHIRKDNILGGIVSHWPDINGLKVEENLQSVIKKVSLPSLIRKRLHKLRVFEINPWQTHI